MKIAQPKTFEERTEVAHSCSDALSLSIPMLVDDMNNTVANAYAAFPDRLFILGADGRIAYRGGRGPRGFKVDEMENALKEILAKSDGTARPGS